MRIGCILKCYFEVPYALWSCFQYVLDGFRQIRRLAFQGQRGGDPQAGEPDLPFFIQQHVFGFEIFVHQLMAMEFAQGDGNTNGNR